MIGDVEASFNHCLSECDQDPIFQRAASMMQHLSDLLLLSLGRSLDLPPHFGCTGDRSRRLRREARGNAVPCQDRYPT